MKILNARLISTQWVYVFIGCVSVCGCAYVTYMYSVWYVCTREARKEASQLISRELFSQIFLSIKLSIHKSHPAKHSHFVLLFLRNFDLFSWLSSHSKGHIYQHITVRENWSPYTELGSIWGECYPIGSVSYSCMRVWSC